MRAADRWYNDQPRRGGSPERRKSVCACFDKAIRERDTPPEVPQQHSAAQTVVFGLLHVDVDQVARVLVLVPGRGGAGRASKRSGDRVQPCQWWDLLTGENPGDR
jgi:hypothetical protein